MIQLNLLKIFSSLNPFLLLIEKVNALRNGERFVSLLAGHNKIWLFNQIAELLEAITSQIAHTWEGSTEILLLLKELDQVLMEIDNHGFQADLGSIGNGKGSCSNWNKVMIEICWHLSVDYIIRSMMYMNMLVWRELELNWFLISIIFCWGKKFLICFFYSRFFYKLSFFLLINILFQFQLISFQKVTWYPSWVFASITSSLRPN